MRGSQLAAWCRWGDSGSWDQGDVHFYDYVNDAFDPDTYPRAKFVSEFGVMSLPSWHIYQQYTRSEDWNREGPQASFRYTDTGQSVHVLLLFQEGKLCGLWWSGSFRSSHARPKDS